MTLPTHTLLREAERLDDRALDAFIADVIALRTRRTHAPSEEARLLKKINKGLPVTQIQRLRSLNQKRREQSLSQSEHEELLQLVEKSEQLNANRLRHLTALARLRQVPVRELMTQLGIGPVHG